MSGRVEEARLKIPVSFKLTFCVRSANGRKKGGMIKLRRKSDRDDRGELGQTTLSLQSPPDRLPARPPAPLTSSLSLQPFLTDVVFSPLTESLALPFISGGMLATETLSEGKRDRGREEERVMARISIPLCCTALLQGLGGMGWGWGCGEGARREGRGRKALLEGGRRQGWRRGAEGERGCEGEGVQRGS